jgi:hypothetical protein
MKKIIRRILREDVNNILYDKVVRMMRRPYIDFLRKNGLGDQKTVTEIMKRKLGDGNIVYSPIPRQGNIEYTFTWVSDKKGYYEEQKYIYSDEIIWVHSDKVEEKSPVGSRSEIIVLNKFINNDGERKYFELTDDRSSIKHNIDNTQWDNAPLEIKNDKFFSDNY